MTAPDLTPAEAARVAEFEAAVLPAELFRERMAEAIYAETEAAEFTPWHLLAQRQRDHFYRRADAEAAPYLTEG